MRQALYSTLYAKRAFRATLAVVFLAAAFGLFAFVSPSVRGEEEREAFLEALKARGYDDVALVYLKSLQDSGQETPELNDEIDYKIGEAALNAYATATSARRDALAAQARDAFEKYLSSSSDGGFALEANAALARLDLEKGDRLLDDARKKGAAAEARDAGLLAARVAFSDAKKRIDAALPQVQTRVKNLQNDASSNPKELDKAKAFFLELLVRSATCQAQTARTFPQDAPEFAEGLKGASGKFSKIATNYSQYVASFTARFLDAQVKRELGDDDGALAVLSELGVLPYEEQFFGLKTRALALYAQIADQRDLPESNMELVRKFDVWENESGLPKEYRESYEGLQIRLLSGRALVRLEKLRRTDYAAFASAGKKTFTDSNDRAYKVMNVPKNKKTGANTIVVLALKTLGSLASGRNAEALEAQNLLKDEVFAGIDLSKYSFASKIDDFESALNAATRDAASFSLARQDLTNAAPDAIAEAKQAVDDAATVAIRSFRAAFDQGARELKPDKKGKLDAQKKQETLAELDKLYLQYAVLCYAAERFEDALAVGDYLARRRPEFEDASQGALVALRSLQQIFASTRERNGDSSETIALQRRLDEQVDFIVERWGQDESNAAVAQEAAMIQLEGAVAAGDVESARAFLQKIPETSPRRSTAELRLGQALWNERQKLARELESSDSDSVAEDASGARQETKKKLDELTDGARQAFYDGLERKLTSSAGVTEDDYLAIYSTYLLALVYEAQNDLENAEKWLMHPVIGARSAVERASQSTEEDGENAAGLIDDNFQLATLALVLRLTIANPERFDEAENVMAKLEEIVKRSPENSDKLTSAYLKLCKGLEERLRALKDAADQGDETKKEELAKTTQGFETFLKRAAAREEGNGYGSLRWIADSFLSLGRGLSGKTLSAPSKEAIVYFAEAGKTYQTILRKIDADANFAPTPNARLAVELKIVECLRCAGAFSKAFDQLKKAILASSSNFDVQIEAARLFQDWGRVDSQYYVKAIVGGAERGGSNLVWGWNGIIKRLSPSVNKGGRYRELFYEAYLSKTRCRYLYVMKIKDAEERAKQALEAENDLKRLAQTRPDLGGAANFKKFDSAYKSFQKIRGEKTPVGLRNSSAPKNNPSK